MHERHDAEVTLATDTARAASDTAVPDATSTPSPDTTDTDAPWSSCSCSPSSRYGRERHVLSHELPRQ